MKKFESREEAFASQNFDPTAVTMQGVPAHIVEAAKAFINLCVAHDAVNPEFVPDYSDYGQDKYEIFHEMGSPSGAGFSYRGYDRWVTYSCVGSRLVSESPEAAKHIGELFDDDFRAMKIYERQVQA